MKRKELKTELVKVAQRNYYEKRHAKNRRKFSGTMCAILGGVALCIFIPATIHARSATMETPTVPTVPQSYYPTTTVVMEVDHAADLVTIRNSTGFKYTFYGAEDWCVGDICSCIMDDCGTDIITDDAVIAARYSGTPDRYILDWIPTTKM